MYTTNITKYSLHKPTQRMLVDVEFEKDAEMFTQQFPFGMSSSLDDIKKRIKQFVDTLEQAETNVSTMPKGIIDLSSVELDRTPEQLEEAQWRFLHSGLKFVMELVDLGVLTGNESKVIALQDKVRTTFKPEFIGLT